MSKWCLTTFVFVRLMLVSLSMQNVLETNSRTAFVIASVTIPPSFICTRISGLSSKQMRFCETYPEYMDPIMKGYNLGLQECEFQFRKRRWNCTSLGSTYPFGRRAVAGTKEDAFSHAIISAGIAHSVTMACSEGNLTSCGCDKSLNGVKSAEGWSWGGCSVNIQQGVKIADDFLNGQDPVGSDIALMSKHNNEVGREVLRNSLVIECKCHGASQSCSTRTCWNRLPSFRTVGKKLYKMFFKKIKKVKRAPPKRKVLVLADDQFRKPKKETEIVYLRESPNYCERNLTLGIPGTRGRTCVKDATDKTADECHVMCCGRGYDKRIVSRKWKCSCKFHWCCYVKCKLCSEQVIVHSCK